MSKYKINSNNIESKWYGFVVQVANRRCYDAAKRFKNGYNGFE